MQWLIERRVEMGFVTLPDNRFHTITLGEDEYVAVLPATHALAARGVTPTATLDGLPFIMMQQGAHRNIEPLLERAGARPRVRYRFTQVISILGVVQQGLGVSIAPRLALPDQFPGVVYRPLEPRAPRRVASPCGTSRSSARSPARSSSWRSGGRSVAAPRAEPPAGPRRTRSAG